MYFWWRSTLIAVLLLCEVNVLARPNLQDGEGGASGDSGPSVTNPPEGVTGAPTDQGGDSARTSTPPPPQHEGSDSGSSGNTMDLLRSVSLQTLPGVFSPPFYVPLSYTCLPGDVVVIEVKIDTDLARGVPIYSRTKNCLVADSRLTYEQLDLPDPVIYRPDGLNRRSLNILNGVISLWIVEHHDFEEAETLWGAKQFAQTEQDYPLAFKGPFDRPRRRDFQKSRACLSWGAEMLLYVNVDSSLQCHPETDALQLAYFPIAFSSERRGVSRVLDEVEDPHQRRYFRREKNHPRFSVSMLVYLKSFCKFQLCSIYHRKTVKSNRYVTPLMFLTMEGKIHFQVMQHDGQYRSMLNHFILPKNEWFRISLKMNGMRWSIAFNYKNYTRTHITGTMAPYPEPVRYHYVEGQTHIGGSSAANAIEGYIADMRLWRGQVKNLQKLEFPDSTHPTRWLAFEEYYSGCITLETRLAWAYKAYMEVITSYQRRVSCPSFEEYVHSFKDIPNFCTAKVKVSVPKHLKFVYHILRKVVTVTRHFDTQAKPVLGSLLMAEAEKTLKSHGLDRYEDLLHLLHQASCFHSHEAAAMLGAMYSAGLKKRKNEHKGLMYTMIAAQEGNVMAKASLGFKHFYGIGGLEQDFDYAYYYLIEVAEEAIVYKEKHGATSVTTEIVRLTDTAQLQYHSGEKGDYFQWMKFQASKGMTDAQMNVARMLFWGQMGVNRDVEAAVEMYRENAVQNPDNAIAQYDYGVILMRARMGRILYWGSGGVKRNLRAATKYYEKTAKAAPDNAVALYDYGVVLMRGQGTEKNMTKALEQLQKAADLGHAPAYTALGWHKLNIEKDYKAAARYFETADEQDHTDATHNLGFMHSRGLYPGRGTDKVQAFRYYRKAAEAGHMDSGTSTARMYKDGVEHIEPDSEQAAKWAYRVAVQHEDFGLLLRKGLDAFLSTSWDVSVLYYLMAAEAGLEVAQFNLAYLCEENYEGVADRYFQRGCQWKYYEMASLSPKTDSSTLLKMGEYYWYGHGGRNDTELAIGYYVSAAQHRLPEAIFNLAYISELGIQIPQKYLSSLGVRKVVYQKRDTEEIAKDLYRICRDDNSGEAYIPCGLALLRLNLAQVYRNHPYACQLSTCMLAASLIGLGVAIVTSYYARQRREEQRQQATSLYHALHNGNMNSSASSNDDVNQNGRGVDVDPPPPPRRRMIVSSVRETDETRRVDNEAELDSSGGNSPMHIGGDSGFSDSSGIGGDGGIGGSGGIGVSAGMGEVHPISASMVLDSDDPLLQARATRLPEARVADETTDLHHRSHDFLEGEEPAEEEEPPTV